MGRWLLWVVCLAVGLGCGGESVPTTTGCTCDSRVCGPNSCGQGSCGDCLGGQACSAGACVAVPCGPTSPAGSCPAGQVCASGACRTPASNCCTGRACGADPSGCASSCGTCASGQSCTPAGQCACAPSCRGRTCGPDGCGGTCGTCAGTQVCDSASGTCRVPAADACSPAHPAGTCPSGQTCTGGACCASSQSCAGSCCAAGSACVPDTAGNRRCYTTCTANSDCPAAAGCCTPLNDPGSSEPNGVGVCVPPTTGYLCQCATPADCGATNGCTPYVRADGTPSFVSVCTAPACAPYRRCTGVLGSCPNGYCNLCDADGNCYCAQVCTSDAMCGGGTCGPYSRSIGSCSNSQSACHGG